MRGRNGIMREEKGSGSHCGPDPGTHAHKHRLLISSIPGQRVMAPRVEAPKTLEIKTPRGRDWRDGECEDVSAASRLGV